MMLRLRQKFSIYSVPGALEPHWPTASSPRTTDNSHDFSPVKWLYQHIIGTQIQGFGPQVFVCKPGSDDKRRRIWQDGRLIEHVLPRTWRQIPLTGDNFELTLPQSNKRGGKRGAGGHCECMVWDKRALQAIE